MLYDYRDAEPKIGSCHGEPLGSVDLAGASDSVAPEMVRAELHQISSDKSVVLSERNRRFLRYVVEETLAGRSCRIKAYSIATEVFGRNADFDPQSDPIVRIEATRIRRALDIYYLTERDGGRHHPVRIQLPKGGYVPVFEEVVTPPLQFSTRYCPKGDTETFVSHGLSCSDRSFDSIVCLAFGCSLARNLVTVMQRLRQEATAEGPTSDSAKALVALLRHFQSETDARPNGAGSRLA